MTVKQLKEKLKLYPDNMDVFLAGGKTESKYGLLNSVRDEEIEYHEDSGDELNAIDTVVILDEE